MKKRMATAGCKLDPDDKDELSREARKRGITLSSLIDKIIRQHLDRREGLSGERDLGKYLDAAMAEIRLSLADDGRISPDEAIRIAGPLIDCEKAVFECPDFRVGVPA